jgi:hypothetical protein
MAQHHYAIGGTGDVHLDRCDTNGEGARETKQDIFGPQTSGPAMAMQLERRSRHRTALSARREPQTPN